MVISRKPFLIVQVLFKTEQVAQRFGAKRTLFVGQQALAITEFGVLASRKQGGLYDPAAIIRTENL
jgi:hypothetical protein